MKRTITILAGLTLVSWPGCDTVTTGELPGYVDLEGVGEVYIASDLDADEIAQQPDLPDAPELQDSPGESDPAPDSGAQDSVEQADEKPDLPDADIPLPPPKALDDLTGPWRLFVDDHDIEYKEGVVRAYHQFKKHPANPVLKADKPWEGTRVYLYGTVMPAEDGPGFRMWYKDLPVMDGDDASRVLYATSADGISWDKPSLGIREWNGSTANNILFTRPGANDICSVIHTPWDPDPNRGYKVVNFAKSGGISGYYGGYSADGIHIDDAEKNPVFEMGGDVGQFFWDPGDQQYVGFVKINTYVKDLRRRSVGRVVASSIESWSDPVLALEPDAIDDEWAKPPQCTHFYGFSAFPYESQHLAFAWVFRATDTGWEDPNTGKKQGYLDGPIHVELASSHDGVQWTREEKQGDRRPPILDLGPPGSFDAGMVFTAVKPLVVGGEIRLYYGGCTDPHSGITSEMKTLAIGLATLRKDGFASLDAIGGKGQVVTKTLEVEGGTLAVNHVSTAGSVRVEVQDEAGAAIPGYGEADCTPLSGDGIADPVQWGGTGELPPGKIRLRFVLENASIYSFRVGQ